MQLIPSLNIRLTHPTQMQSHQTINYIQMVSQITNITVYNKFYQLMNNFETLQYIFSSQCQKSKQLLFAACQILSKKLKNNQLLLSSQDTSQASQHMTQSLQQKRYILFIISTKLYQYINNSIKYSLPDYIIRSCINTISLCINSTINSNSNFQRTFINYFKLLIPQFIPNQSFIKPPSDNSLSIIQASRQPLQLHNRYAIDILSSLLQYIINSAYFTNYYYYRRNLYSFRNNYLAYMLNYSIYCLKSVFKHNLNIHTSTTSVLGSIYVSIRPILKFFQDITMYPFSLNMHQFQIEDQIHQNISGLQSQIYFPSYFRSLLCDTELLMDLIGYYSRLNGQAGVLAPVREDIYSLIRIIGRVLSTSEYIFVGEDEKKAFRAISIEFITRILKQNKFFDSYLIICISKINIKFMSVQNQDQMFQGKKQYFQALMKFICNGISTAVGSIQDGDKHPYRQLFQVLTAFVNISANTILDIQSKTCAQQALNILLKVRLANNQQNNKLMRQFGQNNSQQIDCFAQMFARVPQIFKINLSINLITLQQLNLSALSQSSLTFWLHLAALLLPQHDTSIQQTALILKFLQKALQVYSIASLHYIQTLVEQVLYQIKDGVSVTYLWKFIQQTRLVSFQSFLSTVINYAMKILTVPNYTLIQNCLSLFKAMFTKLCKYRHKSFTKYFQIIQQVCRQIDSTMLVHPDYIKLRIGFFSIISIIWINQGQLNFVYRIFNNIRINLNQHNDIKHFIRYMTDITGLLQPVQSSQVFKIMMQLIIIDLKILLPFYMSSKDRIQAAFNDQMFLKTFMRFILTVVNDYGYRLSYDVHTQLPLQIQQLFRPYLQQSLKYDYPRKTIQVWIKFIKLNPLSNLLPLDKTFKQKNSPHYRSLLREYFQNLQRLKTLQEFYYMYMFIEENIDLMVDWWEEIMARGIKPEVNVEIVAKAHIWTNSRQKEQLGKLLYRIGRYDGRYWALSGEFVNQNRYADWFVANYN